ncbi:hypothetical protein IFM89_011378 [Coptis chinensis]|uniref:Calcineurin-like phosphoesterase domain-containing protein n=1 Tax=Coptis chinensis TaxID=261450 RepID=A0A835HLU6_9MAGN|nr:hypothetical protein IFM89_011378 [Coptis chinensis]
MEEITVTPLLGALKSIRTYMGPVHIKDIALAQILLYENSAASGRHLCVEAIHHFSDFAARVVKLYPEYKVPRKLGHCSASINSSFFASLLEAGDVKAVFTGHDHLNDFCGELNGIQGGIEGLEWSS